VRAADPFAAVAALFEAIEFYAGRVSGTPTFSRTEMGIIKKTLASVPMDSEQRIRMGQVIAMANDIPLRAKLERALIADGVPHSNEELDALWDLRAVRNKAAHGAGRIDPDRNQLELGKGLVNRMLTFRAFAGTGLVAR
jgi:hypothetical protein